MNTPFRIVRATNLTMMMLLGSGVLAAQPKPADFPAENRRPVFSIELDPIPVAFHTQSVGVNMRLGPIWVGIKTFAKHPQSSPSGIRLRSGYLLEMFYVLAGTENILYAGIQGAIPLRQAAPHAGEPKAMVQSIEIILAAGFRWFPFGGESFYFSPAVGIGVLSRSPNSHVTFVPAFAVGYQIQHP